MMDFRVQNVVPPGGLYFYELPGVPGRLDDYTLDGLLRKVEHRMRDNGIEPPADLKADVKNFMCHRLPAGFCYGDPDGTPPVKLFSMAEIRENTRLAVTSSEGFVHPGEAKRRATICASCPGNDRSACPTCVGLVAWALRAVGNRDTGLSQVLGVCDVTGTAIPSLVQLQAISATGEFPDNCWRKTSHAE